MARRPSFTQAARRRIGGLAACGLLASSTVGCSQNSTEVPVRSLERSGAFGFVCLGDPSLPNPGRPLADCNGFTGTNPADFSTPHLYAVVAQTARGELAVIDTSAQTVVDVDPATPGFNFLPMGANPTDVAVSPDGQVVFVTVAEPGRESIFAVLADQLRGSPTGIDLADFRACALEAAPSRMVALNLPGAPATPVPGSPPASGLELVVALPDLGELVSVNAAALAAQSEGSFDACQVDQRLPLRVDLPTAPPMIDTSPAVVDAGLPPPPASCPAETPGPSAVVRPAAHPFDIAASDDGRLFVSDDRAPVIHVVDAANPTALAESAPLLPAALPDSSEALANPNRPITTGAIGVSPLLGDGKRFVYAADLVQPGAVMVFDVSSDSTTRAPIVRPTSARDPFVAPDRIGFSAPIQAITFVNRQIPVTDPTVLQQAGGVIVNGVSCDPTNANDPNRPPTNFARAPGIGAAPGDLRGTFAFVTTTNGQISIVNVEDLDAPCRRPVTVSQVPPNAAPPGETDTAALLARNIAHLACTGAPAVDPSSNAASGEVSCNLGERHRVRSSNFFISNDLAGRHAPAMQSFPVLRDAIGSALSSDQTDSAGQAHPTLAGPADALVSPIVGTDSPFVAVGAGPTASVGINLVADPRARTDPSTPDTALFTHNWVAFDLREPSAHLEQDWTITFEGALPQAGMHVGRLSSTCDFAAPEQTDRCANAALTFFDTNASFCSVGVHDEDAAALVGMEGDVLSITDDVPAADDPYWTQPNVQPFCSFDACTATFGTAAAPVGFDPNDPMMLAPRDWTIAHAFQDHLDLAPRSVKDATNQSRTLPVTCCFPSQVAYKIRGSKQWIVTGSASGFAHHVVPAPGADPFTARCVDSCDPLLALRNGRAREIDSSLDTPSDHVVSHWDDPIAFQNPQMQFAIYRAVDGSASVRDMNFFFHESGGFGASTLFLSAATTQVLPQSVMFVPLLGQLVVSDAGLQGLVFIDLGTLTIARSFF